MENIKFYQIADLLDLEYDGDVEDTRLHGKEKLNWGGKTEEDYEKAAKEIDAISYEGNGWHIYAWYDMRGYDYFMVQREEQNYINITVSFDSDEINRDEIPNIQKAIDSAYEDAYSISERYDYTPNSEYKRGGRIKSALMRDRKYKSNEPHEQDYKRKSRPKNRRYARYKNGGNIGRDLLFKSQEPHEQEYKRKREWKEYKKDGWLGEWFREGGDVGDEVFESLYKKYRDKDYFFTNERIENKIKNWEYFVEKGDENAMKYTKEDIINNIEDISKAEAFITYSKLKEAIQNNDKQYLKSRIRYDQKFSKDIFENLTGKKLPNTNSEIIKFLDSNDLKINKYANGGGVEDNFDYSSDLTDEAMVKQNLMNGEISCETLTKIIRCKPSYPYQIVGAIKLEKCYLRPYYKLA